MSCLPDTTAKQSDVELRRWAELPTARRCRLIAAARSQITAAADSLLDRMDLPQHADRAETIAAELIPLCDALRWLGRHGPRVLAPRRVGPRGRPIWLAGVEARVQRVPRGTVLVIGTWNYPLLLPGVQIAQALAAGNQVLCKPAPGCESVTARLAECFYAAGVAEPLLRVLGSDVSEATRAIDAGVDYVVLTGSAATGRQVLAQAAAKLTPAAVELSGCDAMIVLAGADLGRAAAAVRFGLSLRGGATCIGPRRLLVEAAVYGPLRQRIKSALAGAPELSVHPAARAGVAAAIQEALGQGGTDLLGQFDATAFSASGQLRPVVVDQATPSMRLMHSDVFGPVAAFCRVDDSAAAVRHVNECSFGLAASVFGPTRQAARVAEQLDVGCVTVNDLIVPTADPRLPFGGRRESGYGVTRGPEGLREMTVPRVISVRRRGPAPHLNPHPQGLEEILGGAMQVRHDSRWAAKWSGLRRLIRGVRLSRNRQSSSGE